MRRNSRFDDFTDFSKQVLKSISMLNYMTSRQIYENVPNIDSTIGSFCQRLHRLVTLGYLKAKNDGVRWYWIKIKKVEEEKPGKYKTKKRKPIEI